MADLIAAPEDSSNDPFAKFMSDTPAPVQIEAPVDAGSTVADQQGPDPFAKFLAPNPEDQTSVGGAVLRGAERSALPAAGGLVAAGAGAEAGAALGALAGAPFGGVGAGPGAVVGGIVGGIGGAIGGSAAVQNIQDWAVHSLPESWQDALGQSDRQQQLDQQYHPTASFLGGLLPYALTMRPGGFGAAAALPDNATAWQKILANPITARVFGGATMGGMELGQEAAQGQQPNWTNIAISTGFGMVFNKPTRFGETLTELGASPTRAVLGLPSPTGETPANANAPAETAAAAAETPIAAPAAPQPGVTARDWNETILGQQPPTVAQAGDAKVMGPGITEDVFMGSHQQASEAEMTAQDQARTEASLLGPQPPGPDVAAVARRMEPELFSQYDALSAQRDAIRAHLAQLANPADEDVAAAQAQVANLQQQLDAHVASRNGYAGGPEARGLRAQVRDAQNQVDDLNARRQAFAAGNGEDTPEMTALRQQFMATDIQMRDLAPQVSATNRRAADYTGSETFEPEAVGTAENAASLPAEAPTSLPEAPSSTAVPSPSGLVSTSVQQQSAAIAADVTRQLISAGRPLDEAEASGQLIASHYVARARRFGGSAMGTPLELYWAQAPVIRGVGRAATAVEPAAVQVPRPAIEPQAARAAADSSGDSKLIEQLVGRGASDREISATISRRLSPEQVAAFRQTIAERKPPLMPTVAQPEIGTAPEVRTSRAAEEAASAVPETVNQNVAPPVAAGGIEALDPNSIGVDAKRFQFKEGGDEAGVSERLQGVEKWDPRLAGTSLVYRDADGKNWIADGHQRLGLAKRLMAAGQNDIRLNAFVLDANDGISDSQARAIAAIKNIAEGTGTAVDAAKVLREAKDAGIDLPPLPPRSTLVRDGRALAELSPDAFGIVINDVVPAAQGAMVGRLVKDPLAQVEALRLLAKVQPENASQAELIVRDMLASGTEQMTRQGGLFGDEDFAQSIVLERAKIADEAVKQLRKDKQTFGTLVKETERIEGAGANVLDQGANQSRLTTDEKASDLLTQLAFRAGPVSDALSGVARRLKSGDISARDAAREFLGIVRSAVESGVDTGAEPGRLVAGTAGERQELATEPGAEGLPQTLIPGVEPISERDRIDHEAARPLEGGEAAAGGLFDEDAQNQQTLFQNRDASIDDVLQKARDAGIDMHASETDNRITLSKIIVPAKQRGGGLGTSVMQDLIRYADANGKDIVLSPSTDFGGSSVARLKAFYKGLGFVENKGANKDFSTQEGMIRAPQQTLEQGKRGSITFAPGKKPVLKLFQDANASTFLHETGHQWLEEMLRDAAHPAASDDLKADVATTREYLGMTDDQAAPLTGQHEKFARGFEQYMREGVAPSAGLARVFSQFKTWLTSLYQTIKGLGAPINDDIRGVFDRLVGEGDTRTIIASELEAPMALAALHEQDAAAAHPAEAEPIGDRIAAERDRYIAQQPPEVTNELATADAERAAAAAAESGAETGAGATGPGPVVPTGGEPEPQPSGSGGGGERGQVIGGGNAGMAEGAGVATGGGTANARSDADAGLRQQRPEPAGDTRAQPLAPEPSHLFGAAESPFVDKAGNIRLDTLTTDQDVAQAIRDAADSNNDFIGDRRGVVTDGQVMDLAAAMGMEGAERLVQQRVTGQAFNAEQVMAVRKLLLESATNVSALMKKAATGSDEDVLAYAQAKARHQMIQGQVAGITAEAGRALRAFRDISGQGLAQGVDQFLKTATGKTLFQLKEEAKLGAQLDDPAKVSKFIRDGQKRSFGQMVLEYWINGLISGPATHTTYMIGNTILTAIKAGPETAAAAAIGAARRAMGREGETVRLGEVGAQFSGAVRSLPMATMAALDSLRTGVTTRLPGEDAKSLPFQASSEFAPSAMLNESVNYRTFVPEVFGMVRGIRDGIISNGALLKAGGIQGAPAVGWRYSPLGAIPDLAVRGVPVLPLGTAARVPSRFVAAIHSFFRAANYSIAKNALAYRAAAGEGLAGDALAARIGDLRQNPSPEMMQQARGTATQLTLMGQGSEFVQALGKLTNVKVFGFPLLKFVDPFVHIAGNIVDQSLVQRTPIGLLSPELRADLTGRNGTVAQDTAQARMLVGTSLAIAFGSLAAEGLVSGSGPSDPDQSAMWRLAGNQAHSVRIGDMWYDVHRLGPLGLLMSMSADMYDVAHAASQGQMAEAGAGIIHAFTQTILDEGFMSGPAELIQALEDPGRYGAAYVRNQISSFVPYSVAMGQMAKATDPYARQARGIIDAVRAKVPGMSEALTPRRDIWGQPVPNLNAVGGRAVTAIYMQAVSHDPVNQAMLDLGIHPAAVERKIRGVALTDQQYDQYAALAGNMAKQRLNVIVGSPDFANWSPTTRADVITETLRQSRETARGMVMMRNPSIVSQATQARMAQLRGMPQ